MSSFVLVLLYPLVDPAVLEKVIGLHPDPEKHEFFMNFYQVFICFPFHWHLILNLIMKFISVCWRSGTSIRSCSSEFRNCSDRRSSIHERLATDVLATHLVWRWSWPVKEVHQHAEVSTDHVSKCQLCLFINVRQFTKLTKSGNFLSIRWNLFL